MVEMATSLQVQGAAQNSSPASARVRWRQFLLNDFHAPDGDSNPLWHVTLSLIVFAVFAGVTVVKYIYWPYVPLVIYSDKPYTGNLSGYSCSCFQPPPTALQKQPEFRSRGNQVNYNRCIHRSSIDTVTILQYHASNKAIDTIVREFSNNFVLSEQYEGYVVSDEAQELVFSNSEPLQSLGRYNGKGSAAGVQDISLTLNSVQEGFMNFPQSYVRMAFDYECRNCSSCGLEVMNEHINRATDGRESWGKCHYWGLPERDQCTLSSSNQGTSRGKCILYPTQSIPFDHSIRSFFNAVNDTEGISRVGNSGSAGQIEVKVQPNVVYLNRRKVTRANLTFNFVEVPSDSTLWARLLDAKVDLDKDCSQVPNVTIDSCDGISTLLCNAFKNADGSMQLKCKDMNNFTTCEQIVKDANLTLLDMDNLRNICPPETISCTSVSVPQYNVSRNAVQSADPLTNYLQDSSASTEGHGDMMFGACTNTYTNVFRVEDTRKILKLLQALCYGGTDLCSLTRNYRFSTFLPTTPSKKLNSKSFYKEPDSRPQFLCYNLQRQALKSWLFDYANVLLMWLGLLVFLYKLHQFLRVRYNDGETKPRWLVWIMKMLTRGRPENVDPPDSAAGKSGSRQVVLVDNDGDEFYSASHSFRTRPSSGSHGLGQFSPTSGSFN